MTIIIFNKLLVQDFKGISFSLFLVKKMFSCSTEN